MRSVKVEYTVREDYVETNKANIKKVMDDLAAMGDTGLFYFSSIKEDGKSFVHIAVQRDEAASQILNNLDSFNQFRAQLKPNCEIPPQAENYDVVGKSFDL